jgi:hypothetical protein
MTCELEGGFDPGEILIRRPWEIAVLLFLAGLINYFDRIIVSVVLPGPRCRVGGRSALKNLCPFDLLVL